MIYSSRIQKDFMTIKNKISWINFIGLLLAGIINSVGVVLFLKPVNLYDSGFSGLSMFLGQITPSWFSMSIFLILINFPFYLFAIKKNGWVFTVYSLFAIAVYSAFAYLFSNVIFVNMQGISPIAGTDLLLCAIFGGIISGIGSGLTIRFGGAIDGVEVLAVLFSKKLGISVGTFVMIFNVMLYIVIGCVFNSWTIPLYSIIAYAVGIKAVDFVVEGLDKAKGAFIVTREPEKVAKAINDEFEMGITMVDAKGYYSQKDQTMLYCVVSRFQIGRLSKVIRENDPKAFISIVEISDNSNSQTKLDELIKSRLKDE